MDFSNIIQNITSSLKNLGNKIINFVKENKIISIAAGGLFLILLILIIVLCSSAGKSKKEKKKAEVLPQQVILTEPLVVPEGPEIENDYTLSRKTENKWNDKEAEEWFTVPSQKEIDSLSLANENMIEEIIEAAP